MVQLLIFALIAGYFIYDYIKDPEYFKFLIIPIIVINFLASSDYLNKIDERIRLIIFIIALLTALVYFQKLFHKYKIVRFREKKRLRAIEERRRLEEEISEIETRKLKN